MNARRRRIFLAHAREDKPRIRKLYEELKPRGLDPWLDEVDLIPGQFWKGEITKAIRQAEIFLACLSGQSIKKRGYIQREFREALSAFAEHPPGSIYFIPVRLDDCDVPDLETPSLDLNLRDIQWVDRWEENGLDRLVSAVERALGRVGSPQRAEQPAPERAKPTELEPRAVFRDIDAPWCPELVVIPPGEFMMGSPDDDPDAAESEKPLHLVKIAYPLAVGRFPVTFEEYDHFAAATHGEQPEDRGYGRGRRPVINVSWGDAKAYVEWLAAQTGQDYRLLSEAEWEYACRAFTMSRYWRGDEVSAEKTNYGRYVGKTTEVGRYPANPFGLYDMLGNVGEWVEDCWNNSYEGAPADGSAWISGDCKYRMYRGGEWSSGPKIVRSAGRYRSDSDLRIYGHGFRVARMLR